MDVTKDILENSLEMAFTDAYFRCLFTDTCCEANGESYYLP